MSDANRYETMLGNLGAYLADQGARKIVISDQGEFWSVSWQGTAAGAQQARCFSEPDLMRLKARARSEPPRATSRASLLGVLGQQIDQEEFDLARVEEKTGAFLISGTNAGRYVNERVPFGQLGGEVATEMREPSADNPAEDASDDSSTLLIVQRPRPRKDGASPSRPGPGLLPRRTGSAP
jgi:hypothetical protein